MNAYDEKTQEELEVDEMMAETTRAIEYYDYRINNPVQQGRALRPPGGPDRYGFGPGDAQYKKEYWENVKESAIEHLKERAMKHLEKSSVSVKVRAFEKLQEWADPTGKKREKVLDSNSEKKSMEKSQELSMKFLALTKSKMGRDAGTGKANNGKSPKAGKKDLEPEKD